MSEIRVRRLENPSEADIDAIANVLATVFATDSFAIAVCGGDTTKIYELERATVAAAALAGELWVAAYGEEDFASVATWFPPGRTLLDSQDQREAGYDQLFASFGPELVKWWIDDFLPHYGVVSVTALGEGTKAANWNLQQIGTMPHLQRRGLATALVSAVAKKAEMDKKIVTLESEVEENLAFYRSLGWQVVYGPESFDAIEGRTFPMWVVSS
ncbi:unnamed protein product [Peniophora sp. CBMAI 1063]|nr:unnamed protein product [Peniophora sp. CBMAI 1063]